MKNILLLTSLVVSIPFKGISEVPSGVDLAKIEPKTKLMEVFKGYISKGVKAYEATCTVEVTAAACNANPELYDLAVAVCPMDLIKNCAMESDKKRTESFQAALKTKDAATLESLMKASEITIGEGRDKKSIYTSLLKEVSLAFSKVFKDQDIELINIILEKAPYTPNFETEFKKQLIETATRTVNSNKESKEYQMGIQVLTLLVNSDRLKTDSVMEVYQIALGKNDKLLMKLFDPSNTRKVKL